MFKVDRDVVQKNYENAKKMYAAYGVDTDKVIERAKKTKISLHCWQGDDVAGFEKVNVASQNVVTGNYPGRARNDAELRADIDKVFSMSPVAHKVNLHCIYAEGNSGRGRENYTADDFKGWIDWAKKGKYGLDFNTSFFAHEMMDNGLSLSSLNKKVRDFWVNAGKSAREISLEMGKATGETCVHNIWIPDGLKDNPVNRMRYRENLKDSLDRMLEKKIDKKYMIDTLEGKLFGIGTESFVVGSHEFYMMYAQKNNVGICLDTGHYHPTETVTDKLSSASMFVDDILLHVSRGVRWDSDHVVLFDDNLISIMTEIKRLDMFGKIHIGLDYFDASINRIAAWTTGLRAAGRAMVMAMLEPTDIVDKAEAAGDFSSRIALTEEFKALPYNAVYDKLCMEQNVPVGREWVDEMKKYEADVQSKR